MPDEGAREARELLAAECERLGYDLQAAGAICGQHRGVVVSMEASLRAITKALSRPPVSDLSEPTQRMEKILGAPFVKRSASVSDRDGEVERPKVYHLGSALQFIADEHADVLTPRQTEALYQAASKLWDPATITLEQAIERLGEELFCLSAFLRTSGFLQRDKHHEVYERVVAAFDALASLKDHAK